MKRILVAVITCTLLFCGTANCAAQEPVLQNNQALLATAQEWLKPAAWLARRVQKMAANEQAVKLYVGDDAVMLQLIEGVSQLSTDSSLHRVLVVKVPESEFLSLALAPQGLDEQTCELVRDRFNPSALVSLANGRGGPMRLAASQVLKISRTYMQSPGWIGNLLFILDYGGGYSMAVAFWLSGDNTVTGDATFILTEHADVLLSGFSDLFGREMLCEELSEDMFKGL